MKNKKLVCGSCLLLIAIICLSVNVSAVKPMVPPELELIVPYTGLVGDMQIVVDEFVSDAALCGIKITPVYMPWSDAVMRLVYGDFEIFHFAGLVGAFEDTFTYIYETLCFHFVWYDYWNFTSTELIDTINSMYSLYLGGFLDEAIEIFHEIELLMYLEQPFAPISYNLRDNGQIYTRYLFINCDETGPLGDVTIRKALSYLIDRIVYADLYGAAIGSDVYPLSHLFEWSQYHDTSLPTIKHSIGKAVSTLAKGGYLPAKV
jgi:ABC-type transport system substrate-binding protein